MRTLTLTKKAFELSFTTINFFASFSLAQASTFNTYISSMLPFRLQSRLHVTGQFAVEVYSSNSWWV